MNDSGDQEDSSVPNAVWRKFAEDNEAAIRLSAPREPSALERAAGLPGDAWSGVRPAPVDGPAKWVGESYDAPQPQQAWREMSGRERWRYLAQALLVVIVMTAALLTVSRGTPVPDNDDSRRGDVVSQEREGEGECCRRPSTPSASLG